MGLLFLILSSMVAGRSSCHPYHMMIGFTILGSASGILTVAAIAQTRIIEDLTVAKLEVAPEMVSSQIGFTVGALVLLAIPIVLIVWNICYNKKVYNKQC